MLYIYIQLYTYHPIFHRGKYVKRVGFINLVPPGFEFQISPTDPKGVPGIANG
jgi:hypothetical protein